MTHFIGSDNPYSPTITNINPNIGFVGTNVAITDLITWYQANIVNLSNTANVVSAWSPPAVT